MNRRLEILAVGPVPPGAMQHGVGLRACHFLGRLRERHDIHYIHFQDDRTAARPSWATPVPREEPVKPAWPARIAGMLTLGLPCPFFPAMDRAVSDALAERSYDVALVFEYTLLQYAAGRGVPVVADVVDEIVLSVRREMAITPSWLGKLRLLKYRFQLESYFRRLYPLASACTVVGAEDKESLSKVAPKGNYVIIPNGVDATYFTPSDVPPEPFTLLFSGNMAYAPNVAAVKYFAVSIFPLVLRACPQARWYIVGADPVAPVRALQSDRIIVTGFVPDLRPYLAKAAAVISPLVSGGGIKNKVLEAWAMRKPVVATPLGVSGLAAESGKNVLIAHTPEEFAQQTANLLLDPALADAIAEGGHRTAVTTYSWDAASEKLDELLQRAATQGVDRRSGTSVR